jgi:DNA ligase-associated metallophosphoesterase
MILGDLFHSIYNSSWDRFINFLRARPAYRFTLVHGNHDILSREKYLEAGIELVGEEYVMGKLLLSHYPKEDLEASQYNMAGHIHPSVRLRGRGRQGLRVPCFLFKERSAVLPAFGAFTGMARVEIKKTDRVYGLVNRRVIPLHEAQ